MAKKAYIGIENFPPRSLPSGYTQVEYIESTGTQYIDTGFKPNNNTRCVMDAYTECGTGNSGVWFFGGRTASSSGAFGVSTWTATFGSTLVSSGSGIALNAVRAVVELDKGVVKQDGTTLNTLTSDSFTSEQNMLLHGLNDGGTADCTPMRSYSCKIYDNGTLIRDYIPCKNASGTVGLYDAVNGAFYRNAGTGTFTAGAEHGSVARKVKKLYCGVDGVARKVKRAYVGVGGVARLWWSGGELGYYGTATPLSIARWQLAATTVGDYALFAGGRYGTVSGLESLTAVTDAYNKSLTRITAPSLATAKHEHSAATTGNYAIFAGGDIGANGNERVKTLDAYDASLTRVTATSLRGRKCYIAATRLGNYAIFAGGVKEVSDEDSATMYSPYSLYADAYDTSLTRTSLTNLKQRKGYLSATTVGDYAIIGPGRVNSSTLTNSVDAFNSSLTRSDPTAMTNAVENYAATTVGDYALFGGGGTSGAISTVTTYDTSLTRGLATDLSTGKYWHEAVTVGDYALFGPGVYGTSLGHTNNVVDAYDKSLTRSIPTNTSITRRNYAAASIGDYALFAGGNLSNKSPQDAVDVYSV